MKTTLDLPDELMREIKIRAARDDRRLKDLIAELLRNGLAQTRGAPARRSRRVRLPLIRCAHPARPEDEMTPDRVATVLAAQEEQDISSR
jgi:plasmid stability protein